MQSQLWETMAGFFLPVAFEKVNFNPYLCEIDIIIGL